MILDDLRSGDLVYWRGTGFLAWLVRFWTRPKFWSLRLAPFYHVGIVWRNGGGLFYVDAAPGGVGVHSFAINPPSHAQRTHSAWNQSATDFVRSQQYKRYSYATAALTPFKLAGRGSQAWMCSEFVVAVLAVMGWNWGDYQPTPQGVWQSVQRVTGYPVEVLE